jgi:hypothetical protein
MQQGPPEITDPWEAACWIFTLLAALGFSSITSVVLLYRTCQDIGCVVGFLLLGTVVGVVAFATLFLTAYAGRPPRSVRLGRI